MDMASEATNIDFLIFADLQTKETSLLTCTTDRLYSYHAVLQPLLICTQGRLHQECGHVQIGDNLYLLGGFDVTRAGSIDLSHNHNWFLGSSAVTIYNVRDGNVSYAQDLPIVMNHNAAALSPEGIIHVVGAPYYLTGPTALGPNGTQMTFPDFQRASR